MLKKYSQVIAVAWRKAGRGRLEAGYTVEAAFVMAIVLFTILNIINEAFRLHDQVRVAMVLEESIEIARRDEIHASSDEGCKAASLSGRVKTSPLFHFSLGTFEIQKKGSHYSGAVVVNGWKKEIQIKEFHPEEFLRLVRSLEE